MMDAYEAAISTMSVKALREEVIYWRRAAHLADFACAVKTGADSLMEEIGEHLEAQA